MRGSARRASGDRGARGRRRRRARSVGRGADLPGLDARGPGRARRVHAPVGDRDRGPQADRRGCRSPTPSRPGRRPTGWRSGSRRRGAAAGGAALGRAGHPGLDLGARADLGLVGAADAARDDRAPGRRGAGPRGRRPGDRPGGRGRRDRRVPVQPAVGPAPLQAPGVAADRGVDAPARDRRRRRVAGPVHRERHRLGARARPGAGRGPRPGGVAAAVHLRAAARPPIARLAVVRRRLDLSTPGSRRRRCERRPLLGARS